MADLCLSCPEFSEDFSDRARLDAASQQLIKLFGARGQEDHLSKGRTRKQNKGSNNLHCQRCVAHRATYRRGYTSCLSLWYSVAVVNPMDTNFDATKMNDKRGGLRRTLQGTETMCEEGLA